VLRVTHLRHGSGEDSGEAAFQKGICWIFEHHFAALSRLFLRFCCSVLAVSGAEVSVPGIDDESVLWSGKGEGPKNKEKTDLLTGSIPLDFR
jgi:hypothetical protein